MRVYWLIELRTGAQLMYYTSPGHWGSNVDLATKYHTQAAADTEASWIKITGTTHEIVAVDHMWCD